MRLEDINKQNIFKVPDNYFDQLPTRIQSRINDSRPGRTLGWNLSLKIAAPVFALVLLFIFLGKNDQKSMLSADDYLAQVSTDDLIAYLGTTDISVDEILEELDISENGMDLFDEESLLQDFQIDDMEMNIIIDEYGLDSEVL